MSICSGMASILQISFAYILGGITLLPLLAILTILAAFYNSSTHIIRNKSSEENEKSEIKEKPNEHDVGASAEPNEAERNFQDGNLTAAYFSICRDYIPGGPAISRTAATGLIGLENSSVYQSVYRSIFDRSKTQVSVAEGGNASPKQAREVKSLYFVVLRYAILSLHFSILTLIDTII